MALTPIKYIPDDSSHQYTETLVVSDGVNTSAPVSKQYTPGVNGSRPSKPAQMTAATSGNQVTLTFGAPGLAGAKIYRKAPGETYVPILATVAAGATTYTDTPPQTGVVYRYSHRVFDTATPPNHSLPSDDVSASVDGNFVLPGLNLSIPFTSLTDAQIDQTVTAGDNTVSGGILQQRVTPSARSTTLRSVHVTGAGVAYVFGDLVLSQMSTGASGNVVDFVNLARDDDQRIVVQRFVDNTGATAVDQLRLRLVEFQPDGTLGDAAQTSVATPVDSSGNSTVRAIKIAILSDGQTVTAFYSTDYTEATENTATWVQIGSSRTLKSALFATASYRVGSGLTLPSGTGTPTVAATGVIHGTSNLTGGPPTTGGTTARLLNGTSDHAWAPLPGGQTGVTAPTFRTVEYQEIAPSSTGVTVTAPAATATTDHVAYIFQTNQGGTPGPAPNVTGTTGWTQHTANAERLQTNGDTAAFFWDRIWGTPGTMTITSGTEGWVIWKIVTQNPNPTTPLAALDGNAATTQSTTHPATSVTPPDNSLVLTWDAYDGASQTNPSDALTPPSGFTERTDVVSNTATSNLRAAVATKAVGAGAGGVAVGATWTQTALDPADAAVTFSWVVQPAPGSGGSGTGSGWPDGTFIGVCEITTDATTAALCGVSPDTTGTAGRRAIRQSSGSATAPRAITYSDAVAGVSVTDPAVTQPVSVWCGFVVSKWQGRTRAHIYRRDTKTWIHSTDSDALTQSGPTITSAGRNYVGVDRSGGSFFPGYFAMYGRTPGIMSTPDVEALVNASGDITRYRAARALAATAVAAGFTAADTELWDMTQSGATWTGLVNSTTLTAVGTTHTTGLTGVPFVTGTVGDDGSTPPVPPTTISDPFGLVQVAAATIDATDPTMMDFTVSLSQPPTADTAQTGYKIVFYRLDPFGQWVAIKTVSSAPFPWTTPTTLVVPIPGDDEGNLATIRAIASSSLASSGPSVSIQVPAPQPDVPTDLATPTGLDHDGPTGGVITIYWDAVTGATEYDAYVYEDLPNAVSPNLPIWQGPGTLVTTGPRAGKLSVALSGYNDLKDYVVELEAHANG